MVEQLSIFQKNSKFNPIIPYISEKRKKNELKNIDNEKSIIVAKQFKPELIRIPTLTIHPNRICQYNATSWTNQNQDQKNEVKSENPYKRKYEHLLNSKRTANGEVSAIARRKMSKAIEYLLFLANPKSATSQLTGRLFNFQIAFITLTLPSQQKHTDNEIKQKLLNSFLIELKTVYHVKNYVWRAEKQLNGNIHFHIIIDKYVPWSELRDRWNRIVNKLDYVDNYRTEMKKFHKGGFKVRKELLKKWSYKKQINAYQAGKANDWNSPNSTDIHSIKKVRNIQNYITKYLTKNEDFEKQNTIEYEIEKLKTNSEKLEKTQKRKLIRKIKRLRYLKKRLIQKIQQGRIWGCNQLLSNPSGAKVIVDNQVFDELNALLRKTECNVYDAEYFSVYSISFSDLLTNPKSHIFQAFISYMSREFDYHVQLSIAS